MKELTAADIMSSPLITLDKATPLEEAAMTLSEHHISGALVVDYGNQPLGVISLFDIVTCLTGLKRPPEEPGGFYRYSYPRITEGAGRWEKGWNEDVAAVRQLPVAEIMSTEIIGVDENAPLAEVARTLWDRHIHRVFVSRDGRPVGVISTMDVLRVMTGGPRRPRAPESGR